LDNTQDGGDRHPALTDKRNGKKWGRSNPDGKEEKTDRELLRFEIKDNR
jgi:hypothetical protein